MVLRANKWKLSGCSTWLEWPYMNPVYMAESQLDAAGHGNIYFYGTYSDSGLLQIYIFRWN